MKPKHFIFPAWLILISASLVLASSAEPLEGKDWPALTEQRKIYFIFAKRESDEYASVIFTHSAAEYIDLLDRALLKDGGLKSKSMDQVFKKVVVDSEPGAKEALNTNGVKI